MPLAFADLVKWGDDRMAQKISLGRLADILKVHPRTVLRALTGEENPRYNEDDDETIFLDEDKVCYDLNIPPKVWRRVKANKDSFLTRKEVMDFHEISTSTFKRRKYPIAAKFQRHCRYSEVDVNRHRVENFGHDLDRHKNPPNKDDDDLASIL